MQWFEEMEALGKTEMRVLLMQINMGLFFIAFCSTLKWLNNTVLK